MKIDQMKLHQLGIMIKHHPLKTVYRPVSYTNCKQKTFYAALDPKANIIIWEEWVTKSVPRKFTDVSPEEKEARKVLGAYFS